MDPSSMTPWRRKIITLKIHRTRYCSDCRLHRLTGLRPLVCSCSGRRPAGIIVRWPSAPELPDPLLREVAVERGAADGEAADHVADERVAPGVPQHRLGPAAQLRRQFPQGRGS